MGGEGGGIRVPLEGEEPQGVTWTTQRALMKRMMFIRHIRVVERSGRMILVC